MMKRRTDKLERTRQPWNRPVWTWWADDKKATEKKGVQKEEENAEEIDVKYELDNFRVK